MTVVEVPTRFYRQFDADTTLEHPGEGYGGWDRTVLPLDLDRTAFVVMHAWDTGTPEQYPGWHRCVEYIPRAERITEEYVAPLLSALRGAGRHVLHVVAADPDYYSARPGYRALDEPPLPEITPGDVAKELFAFRVGSVFPGAHNVADVDRGCARRKFHAEAEPHGSEGIAATSLQLDALCRERAIDHLVYVGFAIDGCLLISPGGMNDMQRMGYLCSTIAEGVTAIENKETCATEGAKELALWRVALLFGFVYDYVDIVAAVRGDGT